MGKRNNCKTEPSDAHHRINFLYQACTLLAKSSGNTKLPSYYGYLAKEVSRKIVGKMHPRMKRSLCSACNAPLLAEIGVFKPRIRSSIRKKRRGKHSSTIKTITAQESNLLNLRMLKIEESTMEAKEIREIETITDMAKNSTMKQPRKIVRDKHPNRLIWNCPQCGYRKSILQQPSYKLWIDTSNNLKSSKLKQ